MTNPAKFIWINNGVDIPYVGLTGIPLKNLAINQLPIIVEKQSGLMVNGMQFDLETILILIIQIQHQVTNGLDAPGQFTDHLHLLATIRLYRNFFGQQLGKGFDIATFNVMDIRLQEIGYYGSGRFKSGIISLQVALCPAL